MTSVNKPKTLKEFLDHYDAEPSTQTHTSVELLSLQEYQAEEDLLRALYQTEVSHESTEDVVQHNWGDWIHGFVQLLKGRTFYASVGALGIVCFFLLHTSIDGTRSPSTLTPKGAYFSKAHISSKRTALFIGCWDADSDRLLRIGSGDSCSKKKSLIFGFSLIKKGGYAYIFRLRKGQKHATQLYPFRATQPSYKKPQIMHIVRANNEVQEYLLDQEQQYVTFILLQTTRPLSPRELLALRKDARGLGPKMRALETVKSSRPSFDRFVVHVRHTQP